MYACPAPAGWQHRSVGIGGPHTPVITGASGRLIGFHDLDGHELSFYAKTATDGVRADAVRPVRTASPPKPASS